MTLQNICVAEITLSKKDRLKKTQLIWSKNKKFNELFEIHYYSGCIIGSLNLYQNVGNYHSAWIYTRIVGNSMCTVLCEDYD